jgi:hypothetical protein
MSAEQQRLLEARIAVLERQVQFLLRINGIELSALRTVSDDKLLKYYRDVVQLLGLSKKQYPPELIEQWAQFFCQLSEFETARLQNIVDYEHTWEPFYHLCVRMMTTVRQHKDFATDLGLQHLYGLLDRSRKNLRDIAIMMIKKYPGTLPARAKVLLKDENIAFPL